MIRLLILLFLAMFTLVQSWAHETVALYTPLSFPEATRVTKHTVRIPFKMAGTLITLQASVNGDTGAFVFDTGSSDLILNKRIYKKGAKRYVNSRGAWGEGGRTELSWISTLLIDDFELPADRAALHDLSHLEKSKNIKINGVLGYDVLKQYEIYVDFYLMQLTLFKTNEEGQRIDTKLMTDVEVGSLDFEKRRHGIILKVRSGADTLRIVLDTGAELNHLSKNVSAAVLANYIPMKRLEIIDMHGKGTEAMAGMMTNLYFSDLFVLHSTPTIISDLSDISRIFGTTLDGIVGTWLLQNKRVLLNYNSQTLTLFKWPDH